MADKKDIEFAIKGNDLASKPLAEIGVAIAQLVKSVETIVPASEAGERNLNDLKEVAGNLKTALKNLAADQGTIDQFTKLNEGIAASETSLQALRATATATGAALVGVEKPTKELKQANADAEKAIKKAETALAGQIKKLETVRARAAAAGIDTANLAHAQQLLDTAFNTAAPALARVNATTVAYAENQRKAAEAAVALAAATAREAIEVEKYNQNLRDTGRLAENAAQSTRVLGESAAGATKKFFLFRDEGRTTLSLFQRLRGELLSVGAQFVGLYGAFNLLKSGFESTDKLEKVQQILEGTFGEKAADELKFVAAEAKRLSLNYVQLSESYAHFAASASGGEVSPERIRATFTAFAEVARVRDLSGEETSKLFEGLGRIFAKDNVAFGDLYKRMETTMPGVAQLLREAFKPFGEVLSKDAFNRFIKSGEFTANMLASLADTVHEKFGAQVPAATAQTGAALVRLSNAFDELKRHALAGGALDVFTKAVDDLTKYLESDPGKKFVANIGTAFKGLATAIKYVTENFDAIKTAVEWALGAYFGRVLWKAGVELFEWGKNFNAGVVGPVLRFSKSLGNVGPLLGTVRGALGLLAGSLAAFTAGFEFGTILYNNLSWVRKFGASLIGYVDLWTTALKAAGKALWVGFTTGDFVGAASAAIKTVKDKYFEAVALIDSAGGEDETPAQVEARRAKAEADAAAKDKPGPADAPGEETPAAKAARLAQDKAEQQAALAKLRDEAFKGLTTHVVELRASLLKRSAEDLNEFIAGLKLQLQPLRDEIDRLEKDELYKGGDTSQKTAALRAQLVDIETLAITQKKMEIDSAKAAVDQREITDAFKERAIRIADINRQDGITLTHAHAQQLIAEATKDSNTEILALIVRLQKYISTLPEATKKALAGMTSELAVQTKTLTERPDPTVTDLREQGEVLARQAQKRDAELAREQSLTRAREQSPVQEREHVDAINQKYSGLNNGIDAYVKYLRTSDDLTGDQKELLGEWADKLELIRLKMKNISGELYTASQANEDLARGLTGVGKAFAKSVGTGHSLSDAFHAAGTAFRQFASDFLLKMGEMILQATLLKALQSAGVGEGVSGFVTGIMNAGVAHGGGLVGQTSVGVRRPVVAEWFRNAPRYHSGGLPGLKSGEVPAILQTGEEVLARTDARNAANGGRGNATPQHIQVINAIDHASVVRAGLAAPSNQKVILNIMRANRGAVKQALG